MSTVFEASYTELKKLEAEIAKLRGISLGFEDDARMLAQQNAKLRAALEEIATHRIDSELASREKRQMARRALIDEQSTPTPSKRPVAFRVKDFADGWILFTDEKAAYDESERTGALMQGLYVRDGS